MSKTELRMWYNGRDFVLAHTLEEARALAYRHNTGQDPPTLYTPLDLQMADCEGWGPCVPDRLFIAQRNEDEPPTRETKTCRQWAAEIGRAIYFAGAWEEDLEPPLPVPDPDRPGRAPGL